MLNNRGLKDVFTFAMPNAGIQENQTTALMGSLSNTCKDFHTLFQGTLTERAIIALYQSVIDDNQHKVKLILDPRPELLLFPLTQNFIIESKFTWQRFYVEDALTMAAKRKQLNMFKLLLPYYEALKQDGLIQQAFAAWTFYEMKKNNQDEEEIIIPNEYVLYAKYLIDVFAGETFPNGTNGPLSEKTESALSVLFNILLPKQAVRLDDYLDTELFLLAVYQAYRDYFSNLNWDQRDAFCIRVIGLVQSTLHPETGKLLCESLDDIVNAMQSKKEIVLSPRALSHQLKGNEAFYRVSRDAYIGLGFNFLCGIFGMVWRGGAVGRLVGRQLVWKNYVKQKQQIFEVLPSQCVETASRRIQVVNNRAV